MTTIEAAALLTTALRNVQNYCKRHKLPKRGRDYDITEADIQGIQAELGNVGRPRKDTMMTTIQAGTIAIELTATFGPREAKVLTVNRPSNTAVIQFRDLDHTPSEQNTYTTTLDKIRAR